MVQNEERVNLIRDNMYTESGGGGNGGNRFNGPPRGNGGGGNWGDDDGDAPDDDHLKYSAMAPLWLLNLLNLDDLEKEAPKLKDLEEIGDQEKFMRTIGKNSSLNPYYVKMFKKQAELEMAANDKQNWQNLVLDLKRDIKIDTK